MNCTCIVHFLHIIRTSCNSSELSSELSKC